jgi:hypothetical protein
MSAHKSSSRRRVALLLIIVSSVAVSCSQKPSSADACPKTGVQVFVTATGVITLNAREVSVGALREALEAMNPPPSVVCYSREDPAGEPHPTATEVVDVIIQLRLPAAFYTDSTFTSVVKLPER